MSFPPRDQAYQNTSSFLDHSHSFEFLYPNKMYFLHILSLASLALAAPRSKINTKRQSCDAQEWNIQQFTTFTLNPGTKASQDSPPAFDFTHISFYFDDPNFNGRASCSRSVAAGAGALADGHSYPCDGFGMSFQYFGSSIELQRTGVICGK